MPPVDYWRLTLPVSDEISEGLVNFLWELGALGVVEDEELQAFFPPGTAPDALAEQLRGYLDGLRQLGFRTPAGVTLAPLAEEPWAEAWKLHFAPVEVGTGLLIAPPWVAPGVWGSPDGPKTPGVWGRTDGPKTTSPAVPRTRIIIEPGRAFGTGQHGSTAGCLILLERALARSPAKRVLDLGTGSGILAIAAARLGGADVLAIDSDPDAVASAAANSRLNGVSRRVRCELGDAATVRPPGRASLVLSNLLASAHLRFTLRYGALLERFGTLIAGGILGREAVQIREALAAAGLTPIDEEEVDGWVALAFRRS